MHQQHAVQPRGESFHQYECYEGREKESAFQLEKSNMTSPTGNKFVEAGIVNKNAEFATVVAEKILQMSIVLKTIGDIKDF